MRHSFHSFLYLIKIKYQRSGNITNGVVKRILTKSSNLSRGIKVMLESGEVGRVKEIY